jgi:hypothetical protein
LYFTVNEGSVLTILQKATWWCKKIQAVSSGEDITFSADGNDRFPEKRPCIHICYSYIHISKAITKGSGNKNTLSENTLYFLCKETLFKMRT